MGTADVSKNDSKLNFSLVILLYVIVQNVEKLPEVVSSDLVYLL